MTSPFFRASVTNLGKLGDALKVRKVVTLGKEVSKWWLKMMTLFMKGPCLVARPENCYDEIVGLSSDHRSHFAEVKI